MPRPKDPKMAGRALEFGSFRLFPEQRLLLADGAQISVGSRALEILIVLAEQAGTTLTHQELIARVWPTTIVEEANLRVHVASLRKVLGDSADEPRFIATVPGRGYCFVGPVSRVEHIPVDVSDAGLPPLLTRVIGRDDMFRALLSLIPQQRLVSLVGPGGIGKSTLAVALGRELRHVYPDGVHFIDASSLARAEQIPGLMCSALGATAYSEDPLRDLLSSVTNQHLLLILDGCEQLVAGCAPLCEKLLEASAGLSLLVTSREPLRAAGEWIRRLPPLEAPDEGPIAARDAIRYPAVELFAERAAATDGDFQLTDDNAPVVAEICRRLDGIPLAIELAAAAMPVLGLAGVASGLETKLQVMGLGRRAGLPRHQTLWATLDWSYDALSADEQAIFRRLAVFKGAFSQPSAVTVAAASGIGSTEVVNCLMRLVDKSLVVSKPASGARFRLLDTTRSYAREKLVKSSDLTGARQRYAACCLSALHQAQRNRSSMGRDQWLSEYGSWLDDVLAAIDWSLSSQGETLTGIDLIANATSLWLAVPSFDECLTRVEQALAAAGGQEMLDPRVEMKLQSARGTCLLYTAGNAEDVQSVWQGCLEIAESLQDAEHQMRSLWGLWTDHLVNGRCRDALGLAQRLCTIAEGSDDSRIGDRLTGLSQHLIGNQKEARRYLLRATASPSSQAGPSLIGKFQFDEWVASRTGLAAVCWVLGRVSEARGLIQSIMASEACSTDPQSRSFALIHAACPVSLFLGDHAVAERYVGMLEQTARRYAVERWEGWARCFRALLMMANGEAPGVTALRDAFHRLPRSPSPSRYLILRGEYALALCSLGEPELALEEVRAAVEHCDRHEERWCYAELLRVWGDILVGAYGEAAFNECERLYIRSMDCARQQGASFYALRSSVSLAQLYRDTRPEEAVRALTAIRSTFEEGVVTADILAADRLIKELGSEEVA